MKTDFSQICLRKKSAPARRFRPVNWKNAPQRAPHYRKVMSTAYVMSRDVIIKALLPHRDTISIMTAFSTLDAAQLYFSEPGNGLSHVSKPG